MDKAEIFSILKNAMMELLELEENKISLKSKIYEDLEIDSIDAIDLVNFMQKKTGYKLMPEDFKTIKTVEDIVNIVAKGLAK